MEQYNFTLTSQAEQDLKDIWLYIAGDNVRVAEEVLDKMEQAFSRLPLYPNIGSKREEFTNESVRFCIVHNYYIIYNPNVTPIEILRIMSSYQDIKTHL